MTDRGPARGLDERRGQPQAEVPFPEKHAGGQSFNGRKLPRYLLALPHPSPSKVRKKKRYDL